MPDYTTIRVEKWVRDELVKISDELTGQRVNINEAVVSLLPKPKEGS